MQTIQSKLLNRFKNLNHRFTSKLDGNFAFHVGDNSLDVLHNHAQLAHKLALKQNALIYMKQIHSSRVYVVKDDDNFERPPTCDALITDKIDIALMVMVADCSPILFYDDNKRVIAVAHAGRAGAFQNIIQNVINSFIHEYHSCIEDIYVSVGASIGSCCYEVGHNIYQETKELDLDYAIEKKDEKYFLDIKAILKNQLLDAGVLVSNIEITEECNACLHERYFSYRVENKTGRFAGVIKLN